MTTDEHSVLDWPRLFWAGAAVLSGCALLIVLEAPARMPLMNGVAFLIGLAGLAVMVAAKRWGADARLADSCLFGAAMLLPLAAMAGPQMDGVARWLVVAGITIQPALIIVPLLALSLSARPSLILLAAIGIAALGLALQPDPGAAAMLTLGLAAPLFLIGGREPIRIVAVAMAAAALAVAQARSVPLPPVPFVEQVLADALRRSPLAACLAIAATGLMFLPAAGIMRSSMSVAFVAVWSTALAMALLGSFPTPVVGFGGSAILGYILGVGLLSGFADKSASSRPSPRRKRSERDHNVHFA